MHGMDIREIITKRHKLEGCSIRSLAREHGMSRKTIRKMLEEGGRIPEYTRKKERSSPVTGPFLEIVETWLRGDLKAPPKQRHTAKRIYRRLVDEYGFKGAESTIRKVVARMRDKIGPARESYVPLSASPGEQAQVDWGEAVIRMNGEEKKVHLFCMRLRSSGTCFVRAYPGEKLEDFMDGHRAAFDYFGGVPGECWYDNLKTAVTKILSGPKRIEHEHFSALKIHYLFDAHFCGAGKGNEKGSVENLVGYVRRNALVPVGEYRDLASLNDHLVFWCDGERERKGEKWEREREALRRLPAISFDCSRSTVGKVGQDNLVRYDCNAYSVPDGHGGSSVTIRASWDRIRISRDGDLLAAHERSREKGRAVMDILHYIPVFEHKSRAVRNATVVRELGGPWEKARLLLDERPEGYRELAAILLLLKEHPLDEVARALEEALNLRSPEAAVVRQILLNRKVAETPPEAEPPEILKGYRIPVPELGIYDRLGRMCS